ncbi:MAG: T9SS type A sorting domain-containing protein [Pseudarcicella sp.]|nr:T9SS type A sorting domain-containing protein [Pseudarcicella sp.]
MLFIIKQSYAQKFEFEISNDIVLDVENIRLNNPWAGGLNAPQFSTCKINNDTIDDLVVFERSSQILYIYIATKNNEGKFYWKYTPGYEKLFPEISSWILMVDYDNDGKKDIFTKATAGIKVYRNTSSENELSWKLESPLLMTQGFTSEINLAVPSSDLPAITDIDNDGDIDILVFQADGNTVEFHKNLSQDKKDESNRLIFKKIGLCWGNFRKEHFADIKFDIDCEGYKDTLGIKNKRIMHAGNSLLLLDLNSDGKKDVLYGHVTANRLGQMYNIGTLNHAIFDKAEYNYPVQKPVDMPNFASPFFEDVDFDNKKDLIVAVSTTDNNDFKTDFKNSVWLYKNKGTSPIVEFDFLQSNFLQNTMLDLGENTSPLLMDYDNDEDLDLIVGNNGERTNLGVRASLFYFENIGDKKNAHFILRDKNFMNFSNTILGTHFSPFINDMNGDFIPDFGFHYQSFVGTETIFIPNLSRSKNKYVFDANKFQKIKLFEEINPNEKINFVDINQDGRNDLLVSNNQGEIDYFQCYFENGTNSYKLTKNQFGKIKGNYITGKLSLACKDLNGDGNYELITSNNNGFLTIYNDFIHQSDSLKPDSTLIASNVLKNISNYKLGYKIAFASGDLDGDDKPDLVMGSNTGGLKILTNKTLKSKKQTENTSSTLAKIYPNPSNGLLWIIPQKDVDITVNNTLGQKLYAFKNIIAKQETEIDLHDLSPGMYLIEIKSLDKKEVKKIILRK